MKILLLFVVLAVPAFGQAVVKCDVSADKLPALRGVRLRMPESEVAALPVLEKPAGRPVAGSREFDAVERVSVPGLIDTPAFSVKTFDQRVGSLSVYYSDQAIAKNTDEFVKTLSKNLSLPIDAWTSVRNLRTITCSDFTVTVHPMYNFVMMIDTVASRKIAEAANSPKP